MRIKNFIKFNESKVYTKEDILPELLELSDIDFLDNNNFTFKENIDSDLIILISKRITDQIVWDRVDGKFIERPCNYKTKNIYNNIERGNSEHTEPRIYSLGKVNSDKEKELIYAVDEDAFRLVNTLDYEYCSYNISIKENNITNPETFNTERIIFIDIEIKLYKKNPL